MRYKVLSKENVVEVKDFNRRRAIRQKCLECSGWIPKEARECNFTNCPLHSYRMGKLGEESAAQRKKDIRTYCIECSGNDPYEVKRCPAKTCALFPYRGFSVDRSVESPSKIDTIEKSQKDKNIFEGIDIHKFNLKRTSIHEKEINI